MLSQTYINFFHVLNTKEDILKNVGNQTVAGPLDCRIKKILWKSLWTSNCLNSIYVQQKKETQV